MYSLPELELHSKLGQQGFSGRRWFGARKLQPKAPLEESIICSALSKSSQCSRFGPFPGGGIAGAVQLCEDRAQAAAQNPASAAVLASPLGQLGTCSRGVHKVAPQGNVLLLLQSPFPVCCQLWITSHEVKYSPEVFGGFLL